MMLPLYLHVEQFFHQYFLLQFTLLIVGYCKIVRKDMFSLISCWDVHNWREHYFQVSNSSSSLFVFQL